MLKFEDLTKDAHVAISRFLTIQDVVKMSCLSKRLYKNLKTEINVAINSHMPFRDPNAVIIRKSNGKYKRFKLILSDRNVSKKLEYTDLPYIYAFNEINKLYFDEKNWPTLQLLEQLKNSKQCCDVLHNIKHNFEKSYRLLHIDTESCRCYDLSKIIGSFLNGGTLSNKNINILAKLVNKIISYIHFKPYNNSYYPFKIRTTSCYRTLFSSK